MLKYPCLVLDHDDTVVQSEATVNYPFFVEYMPHHYQDWFTKEWVTEVSANCRYAASRGYAGINYDCSAVAQDNRNFSGAFYTLYPYKLLDQQSRNGTLLAWAWGVSKIIDAMEQGAGAELGIDPARIGVGGDSAGGTLTVTSCMMARDRGAAVRPLFQLLVYPWLDGRNTSESYRKYTDTPMWNSTLSKKVGPIMNPDPSATPLAYRSPVEAESHANLPPAYVEVAEFDCLHDDGVLYTHLLQEAGVEAELHEVKGTMHGFDTVFNAPTSQRMIQSRITYMRRKFFAVSDEKLL